MVLLEPITGIISGTLDNGNVASARSQLLTVISNINSLTQTGFFPTASTVIISPGVYTVTNPSFSNLTSLTFDAGGNTNAQFFIRSSSSINLGTLPITMSLINGAFADNIYWVAASNITFAAVSPIFGTFISVSTEISLDNASLNVNGRLWAYGTAVRFAGTTTINDTNVCYLKGTKILCEQGYVPIEDLKVGDLVVNKGKILNNSEVVLEESVLEPITWIGSYRAANLDKGSIPFCIKKDTFGENSPSEDLFVSPGHRIIHDGKLLLVSELGDTVSQHTDEVDIVYYHFKLSDHSVVDANGLLSETYLELDNSSKVFNT